MYQPKPLGLSPPLGFIPPCFGGGRRRRRRENFGLYGLIFIDFLNKIDDFEAKMSKNFAPAPRFFSNIHF